jgi:hypothetical protein
MTRTEIIQAAFEKYGSDKSSHGYSQFYADVMPEAPKKMLEIGVKEGASARAWKEIFPDVEYHGLDIFEEFPIPMIEGCHFWKGNQCDWRILEQLRKLDFDIIIDDGSHNSRDQLITFFGLFNGKHYFIEDLHCCKEEFYRQGLPEIATALELFPGTQLETIRRGNIMLLYVDQTIGGDQAPQL